MLTAPLPCVVLPMLPACPPACVPAPCVATPTKQPTNRFHVITSTTGQGNLSRAAIDGQIDVLNKAFAPNFQFTLVGVDYTANNNWFNLGSGNEGTVKSKLRKGGLRHLNLYTGALSGGLLGVSVGMLGCHLMTECLRWLTHRWSAGTCAEHHQLLTAMLRAHTRLLCSCCSCFCSYSCLSQTVGNLPIW